MPGLTPLFGVRILHNFYNLQDGRCTDFQVSPTPDSARSMGRLGLRFQQDRDGFGVYVASGRADALADTLAAEAGADGWNVLSFMLFATNPSFRTITALPFAYPPAANAFHVCNTAAVRRAGAARLSERPYVDAGDLVPLVPASFEAPVTAGARLTVSDLSGQVVADSSSTTRIHVFGCVADIDLGGLPFGYYVLASTDAADAGYPRPMLYAPATPRPTGWLDMVLTRPAGVTGGVYPIQDGARGRTGAPLFQLPFDAVATVWWYYVLSQDPASRLESLAIHGKGASFEVADDPPPVPGDRPATVLRSRQALPLRQKPALRFHLTGTRVDADAMTQPVRVDPLPLAPVAPVWPGAGGDSHSEMFVYV